jgi:PhnB protein
MKTVYKPEGYNSVSPYLIVDGAQKMIDLLEAVFEARPLRRYERPDGRIMHAELQIDDSVIMLADSNDAYPPNNVMMHVYVPDVYATFNRIANYGCEVIEKPVKRENDPDVRGAFRDFQGNYWGVGTQKKTD